MTPQPPGAAGEQHGDGPRDVPQPSVRRVALLVGTLIALSIVGSSAVAVALPVVGDELELTPGATAWVLAGYSLTFSVSTAVFGRLADLRGLRLPLRIGIVVYAAGSVVAAAAGDLPMLLAGRLVQGAGGGAVPVLGLGIIGARFSGAAHARALGGLTAVVSIVSGSGPLIGGALTAALSWRVVVGLPALTLLLLRPVSAIAPDGPRRPGRLDWAGALLVTATVGAATVLLQSPATGGPGSATSAVAAVGVVAAGLLVRHVRRHPAGLLPAEVVGNRGVLLSGVAGLTLLAAYLAGLFGVPLLLTESRGWSPLQIGVALVPAALAGAVASRVVGGLTVRWPAHRLAALLAGGSAVGLLGIAASGGAPALTVAGMALVVIGFAGGQVALIHALPARVAPAVRGVALGLFNLMFFTGGAIGSAAAGGLAERAGLPVALAVVAALPVTGALCALRAGHPS